jgi:hypothetical protein
MLQPKPITGGILLQNAPAEQGGAHSRAQLYLQWIGEITCISSWELSRGS